MKTITAAEYNEAISHDLAEAFELFVQQRAYFEVLNVTSGIVGTLSTFNESLGEFFNASAWFAHDGKEYAFETAEREGRLKIEHYRFDTVAEAAQFAAGLLANVTDGV